MITLQGLRQALGFVIIVALVLAAAYALVVAPQNFLSSFNIHETVRGLQQ